MYIITCRLDGVPDKFLVDATTWTKNISKSRVYPDYQSAYEYSQGINRCLKWINNSHIKVEVIKKT